MKFSFFTLTGSSRISCRPLANVVHRGNASIQLVLDSLLTGRRDQCKKGAQQRKPAHPRGRRGIEVPHVCTKLFGSNCIQPNSCSERSSQTPVTMRQATWQLKAERLDSMLILSFDVLAPNLKRQERVQLGPPNGFVCSRQVSRPHQRTPLRRNNTFYLVYKPSCCSYSPHPPSHTNHNVFQRADVSSHHPQCLASNTN